MESHQRRRDGRGGCWLWLDARSGRCWHHPAPPTSPPAHHKLPCPARPPPRPHATTPASSPGRCNCCTPTCMARLASRCTSCTHLLQSNLCTAGHLPCTHQLQPPAFLQHPPAWPGWRRPSLAQRRSAPAPPPTGGPACTARKATSSWAASAPTLAPMPSPQHPCLTAGNFKWATSHHIHGAPRHHPP